LEVDLDCRLQGPNPLLILTGERRKAQILVRVNGRPGWITCSKYSLLVRLIIERGDPDATGYLSDPAMFYPEAVWGLRKALDRAGGEGTGRSFIETGAVAEY